MVPPVYLTARRHTSMTEAHRSPRHGGLHVDKQKVGRVTRSVNSPYYWKCILLLKVDFDEGNITKYKNDSSLPLVITMPVL